MIPNLTRKQHFVPQFYLKNWAINPSNNLVYYYDLIDKKMDERNPRSILWEEFLYEEDVDNPDNRIEDMLGQIETRTAPVFREMVEISNQLNDKSESKKYSEALMSLFQGENMVILKDFAAFQYLRMKHVMSQKQFEIDTTEFTEEEMIKIYNLGRFVESGYAHIRPKYDNLKVLMSFTFDGEFITSDWPLYDVRDADYAPAVGEELGVADDVVGQFPLTPKITATFIPNNFYLDGRAAQLPDCVAYEIEDDDLINFNQLIIQQAIKYVVSASINDDFVFREAARRKRETQPEIFGA
jgi:uncharacterized protein DUF4238